MLAEKSKYISLLFEDSISRFSVKELGYPSIVFWILLLEIFIGARKSTSILFPELTVMLGDLRCVFVIENIGWDCVFHNGGCRL